VYPKRSNLNFPSHILQNALITESLDAHRVAKIRPSLLSKMSMSTDGSLSYAAPWDLGGQLRDDSVDLLVSQAVMEHVDDIDAAYAAMRRWLRNDGFMSYRIDYTSHGITRDWYGDWTLPTLLWRTILGRGAYLVNRLPHSSHLHALSRDGFEVLACARTESSTPAPEKSVLVRHSPGDLMTKGTFIVAEPKGR
jgi:hypothetical protein